MVRCILLLKKVARGVAFRVKRNEKWRGVEYYRAKRKETPSVLKYCNNITAVFAYRLIDDTGESLSLVREKSHRNTGSVVVSVLLSGRICRLAGFLFVAGLGVSTPLPAHRLFLWEQYCGRITRLKNHRYLHNESQCSSKWNRTRYQLLELEAVRHQYPCQSPQNTLESVTSCHFGRDVFFRTVHFFDCSSLGLCRTLLVQTNRLIMVTKLVPGTLFSS